ncbi:MAG: hypothetical protein ACTH2Q_09295 [Propionibacteriaceae bacterium]
MIMVPAKTAAEASVRTGVEDFTGEAPFSLGAHRNYMWSDSAASSGIESLQSLLAEFAVDVDLVIVSEELTPCASLRFVDPVHISQRRSGMI